MIDYDNSLSSKQINDILKHICNQHLNFMTYGHPIISYENNNNNNNHVSIAWNYFKTLSLKERYDKLYLFLNENNFKLSFLSLLNTIKFFTLTHHLNGTFICLRSHLENMFHMSQRNFNELNKNEKIRSLEVLKLYEYDENVLWNSEQSDCLLNNIYVRNSFAFQYLQTPFPTTTSSTTGSSTTTLSGPTNIDDSNYFLILSSKLISDTDLLQNEITNILINQYRYMV